jgi:ABC-type multidrug transport system fused ATPase/permease subunit
VLPYLLKLALSEKRMYWRLGLAMFLMLCSKSAGLASPIFMKQAVNALGSGSTSVALHFVFCFGLCQITNHLCKEAQHPTFTPLSQAVAKRVAVNTFHHVLNLDYHFHLNRRTGKLSRILERGTRSVQMLYRAVIFTFLPTTIELLFVCGLLAHEFNSGVAVLVGVTFVAYVTWTLLLTQRATEVRKKVNESDNRVTSKVRVRVAPAPCPQCAAPPLTRHLH